MRTYDGRVDTIVAGDDITIDSTDPANPTVTYSGTAVTDTNIYTDNGTIDATRLVTVDIASGGSLQFSNPIGYNSDESNNVSGNNFPTVTYVNGRLGGQPLAASMTSPSSGEDGYVVTWDNTNSEFELQATPAISNSGDTQANAGAATGELWITSGHTSLPDGVVMQGL